MTLPTQIKIEVKSDLKAVDLVLLRFNKIYDKTIVQQDWLQCQLALVEGFTNAVRHAHKDLPPQTPIQIVIDVSLKKIVIRIWDYGEPFDLENFIELVSQKDHNWQGSGRGIAIIKKVADTLSYERVSEKQNCLTIVKFLKTR